MLRAQSSKSPIARRLILYIVLFSSFITILITVIQLYRDYNTDIELIHTELEQIENIHLNSLTSALWASNRKLLQTSIEGILKIRDMQYVEIRDSERIWAVAGKKSGKNTIQRDYPITYRNRNKEISIGNMKVVVGLEGVYQRLIDKVWVILISNALKIFLVAIFIYYLFIALVARHLSKISQFAETDDPEAKNKPLVLDRATKKHDEFEIVVDSINDMHNRLHAQIDEANQKEQYLSLTLNSIGDAVIATDSHGNVKRMNPVAEQLTGWSLTEAEEKPLKSIFPIIDATTRQPIESPVDKVIATGEIVYLSNHTTLIAKDKSEYQIADSAAPICDADNNILGMVLVFNDVTEQYQLRQAVAKSQRNLQAIMDNTSAVVYIKNTEGHYIYINQQYEKLFHINNEEIVDKTDYDLFPKEVADELQQNDRDVLEAKRPLDSEETIPQDDGLHIYLSTKFPLLDDDGNVYAICGISTDITERKRNDEIISNIATGISAQTGEVFFQSLVTHLAKLFNAKYAFIGLLDDLRPDMVDTVALCVDSKIIDNLSYRLANTPCEYVIGGDCDGIHTFPQDLQRLFPDAPMLVEMGVQSYVGAPLADENGKPIGLVVVMDNKPIAQTEQIRAILRIFATRAAAEMQRLKTLKDLQQSKARLDQAQHQAHIGNWELDLLRNELHWSDEIYRIFEIDPDKFAASYNAFLEAIHPDDRDKVNIAYTESVNNKKPYSIEHRLRMPDGKIKHVIERCETFYDEQGNPIRSTGTVQDITDQAKTEEALRHTLKMDALGKLTGGIAHDYNNMLGVVLGYSTLLKDMLSEQPNLQDYVNEITRAGERGAKLTKKLLAFSRNKLTDVEKMDINTILREEQYMLEKTLTARIKLELKLEKGLWPVCLDESELEDAILNMSINAMHAIESNGQLTIETSNEQINTIDGEELGLESGDYVRLSITDTGHGMDEATKEKIFDPFYSTKGEKGTGLGLSQVYGFIKRCGGTIKVDSELEQGTRFTLYFPRYQGEDTNKYQSEVKNNTGLKGKETILVVDDEPALLKLICEILSQQGYQVFRAERAKQALEIMETKHIDLLLSDIIMPDMDGYALVSIVQEKYPGMKIQLASGFSGNEHTDQVDKALSQNIIYKPYNAQTLLKRIQALLQ
ncbi:MAG: PAS domain-containing protein [Gammaproteobacteria bacterium]|nr:PAS domain-containing protein [Gammaproteobacteria bacterium]